RAGTVQACAQRFGQRRKGDGGPGGAAGEHYPPFRPVQPALRRLGRAGGLNLVEDIGVSVIDRDQPVSVGVRRAGAQTLDEGSGEYRTGRGRGGRGGGLALEGVLSG